LPCPTPLLRLPVQGGNLAWRYEHHIVITFVINAFEVTSPRSDWGPRVGEAHLAPLSHAAHGETAGLNLEHSVELIIHGCFLREQRLIGRQAADLSVNRTDLAANNAKERQNP
jgi:hypothetical protein